MKLSNRKWKIFIIGDLFSVKRPISRNKNHYENGDVPFVASGSVNNGVMKCCKPHKNEELDDAGCITVSPVDGSAFYQSYAFLGRGGAGSSILMLYANNINLYSGQFIAKMISNTCACKYTYGHMGNKDSIKRERIMLPVGDNDEPDYQFMEDYMKELMAAKRKQYQEYIEQRLAELGIDDVKNTDVGGYNLDLESRDYKPFRLSDIFKIDKGVYLPKWNIVSGDKPFITAKAGDNGISRFIGNDTLFSSGKITVEKIKLSSYYQPQDFYCSHDVSVLDIGNANEYMAQFICTMIMRNSSKYSYGRQAQMNVVKREVILLPVDDNNEPDYEFMEECGRKMIAKKYIQYLQFLKSTYESEN